MLGAKNDVVKKKKKANCFGRSTLLHFKTKIVYCNLKVAKPRKGAHLSCYRNKL
jgi:hypothetical protein